MAATFGMGLSGCNDDNNSSNTGGNTDGVNSPKGTVQGAVIDTNGNPLAGAQVFLDGRSQTTGVSGQYRFEDVAVTLATTPNNNTPAANAPIPITIIAPAGYLGANLQIGPQAQITSSDNGGLGGGQTNPQLVFVDGFNAGAGTVVLPQLNTTVRGVLRDSITGQPLANRVLTADFNVVNPDQGQQAPSGVIVRYQASGTIVAQTTGADGTFTFTGLAADSTYELGSAGLDIDPNANTSGLSGNALLRAFGTNPESNNTVVLNDVFATVAISNDLLPPYLDEIAGRISGRAAARADLESRVNGVGATGALEFVFSEPLAGPLNTSTVRVFVRSENAVDLRALAAGDYTVSYTGRTLSIQTTTALLPGDLVTVSILPEAVRDLADVVDPASLPNQLVKVPTAGTNPGLPVGYVQLGADDAQPLPATVTDGTYQIAVRIFKPTNTNADAPGVDPAAGLGQITIPVNPTDFNYVSTTSLIDTIINTGTINPTVFDAPGPVGPVALPYGWQGSIEQLNGTGAVPQRLALQRLNDALNDGLVNGNPASALQNDPGFVHPNTALVKFTVPANAARVAIGLTRPGRASALDVGFFPLAPATIDLADNPVTSKALGDGINRFYINPNGATTISVIVAGGTHGVTVFPDTVLPGDTVVLDSIAAAGTTGAAASIALVDHVAPTTEVQLTMDAIAGGGSVLGPAGGGAVVPPNGVVSAGTPILPISPQLLDVTDTTNTPAAALTAAAQLALVRGAGYELDDLRATNEIGGLSRSTIVNDPATAVNEALSAKTQLDALEAASTAQSVAHNAAGTAAAMVSSARRIGFAFTEPVTLVAGATVAGTGFTLTNLLAETRTDEDGKAVYLITADVNDIFAFEAAGRTGAVVDFTAAITDAAGNAPTAATNAKVALRDYLPPLMLRAFADNTNFVFDFHEAIDLNPAIGGPSTITITGPAGGTCDGGVTVDLNAASQLTVSPATLAANLNGVANARVIVPMTVVAAAGAGIPGFAVADCFDDAATYGEGAIYTKASLGAATALTDALIAPRPTHFAVDYSNVADRAGSNGLRLAPANPASNRWARWEALVPNLGIDAPIFAGANIVGDFNVVDAFNPMQCGTNVTASTTTTCEIQLTHPLLISAAVGNDFDGDNASADDMVTNAELLAFFNNKFGIYQADGLAVAGTITGVTLLDAGGVTLNSGGSSLTRAQANSSPRIILTFTGAALNGDTAVPATVTRVWLDPNKTLTSALTGTAGVVDDGGVEFDVNGQRVIKGLIRRDDGDATIGQNGFVPAELRPSVTQVP